MVKDISRIVLAHSMDFENPYDYIPTESGTISKARNGNFIGILDKTSASDEQLIIGRIIKDQGMIFLRLSNQESARNSSVVFTTLDKTTDRFSWQTLYQEIESTPVSQYKPYEPVFKTTALLTDVDLQKKEIRELSEKIKRWKRNTSRRNLDIITGFEIEISRIMSRFYDELDAIKTWSLMTSEEQGKVLEKQSPNSSETQPS